MIKRIGVVSPVMSKANIYVFSNLINILNSISCAISSIVIVDERKITIATYKNPLK